MTYRQGSNFEKQIWKESVATEAIIAAPVIQIYQKILQGTTRYSSRLVQNK